jgi:hypothetical protein
MKKIFLSIACLSIFAVTGFSQAVSDRATVPVAVNLNRILRLGIIDGGNIEFTFNTIDQYEKGISGDFATSGSAGIATSDGFYKTTVTVSSSTKWQLAWGAEDATLIGVDNNNNTLALTHVGYGLAATGVHQFNTGANGANDCLLGPLNTNGTAIAALSAYGAANFLITSDVAPRINAGDIADNQIDIIWRCGTGEAGMEAQGSLLGITPDRYVTNVLFNLEVMP